MSKIEAKKTNKAGRKKKSIDFYQLIKLCEMHCTQDEVCCFFDITDKTLTARLKEVGYEGFSDYFKKHSGGGKISLRRLQFQSAKNGNVPMQIWLGKNILGQKDGGNITNSETRNSTTVIIDTNAQ